MTTFASSPNDASTSGPRPYQEDSYYTDVASSRLAVADGMGNHSHGDYASGAAVTCFVQCATLDEVKVQVHEQVREVAGRNSGTTLSCATYNSTTRTLSYLHVGDSALWLVTGGGIQRLTQDQSVWGEAVAAGTPPAQVSTYYKHQIASCIYIPRHMYDDTPAKWDEGTVVVAEDEAPAYLFGTTDGFHEAFEAEDGSVDVSRLRTALLLVREMAQEESPAALQAYMDGVGNTTGDNATVAWIPLT